ncbi:hypothetical protein JCM8547_008902 [Rhodosporidiobolus lusitaniae]
MSSAIPSLLLRFRDDLNAAAAPSTFTSYFTSSTLPTCIEHGPPGHSSLPFLGRPFTGHAQIEEYYNLIGTILKGEGSRFNEEDLLVKEKEGRGKAKAVWTGEATWSVQKTGKEWEESVVWAFDLIKEEAAEWKIEKWEVWADTLSAYLASKQ